MYHPMLTLAVAQTRADDLRRDLALREVRVRPELVDDLAFDTSARLAGLRRRLDRYAARRAQRPAHEPSARPAVVAPTVSGEC